MPLFQVELDLPARYVFFFVNFTKEKVVFFTFKEEFALTVLQEIFDNPSLDLMLLKPRPVDLLHADALNRLNALVGFESTLFTVSLIWKTWKKSDEFSSLSRLSTQMTLCSTSSSMFSVGIAFGQQRMVRRQWKAVRNKMLP
jgi:hypothetical protein